MNSANHILTTIQDEEAPSGNVGRRRLKTAKTNAEDTTEIGNSSDTDSDCMLVGPEGSDDTEHDEEQAISLEWSDTALDNFRSIYTGDLRTSI